MCGFNFELLVLNSDQQKSMIQLLIWRHWHAPKSSCRISDILGDRAISCGIGGERILRHNHVREALFQTAVQAGLGPVKEPACLLT